VGILVTVIGVVPRPAAAVEIAAAQMLDATGDAAALGPAAPGKLVGWPDALTKLEALPTTTTAAPVETTTTTEPPPPPPTTTLPPITPMRSHLAKVRGIVVHESIAPNLAALLGAAEADGFMLGGEGHRDVSSQIALRRANCGDTDEAIYEMDPFQCSPPTARPGTSNHERGLAIDFTMNGIIINKRMPVFAWLVANAKTFGFYNLPSEPWHWSVDGN
jgi:hypothetical protein